MIEEQPLPWPEVLETLYRRRWVIATALLIGLLVPTLGALLEAPIFQVKARLLLAAQAVSGPRAEAMAETQIKSEIALLRSTSLVRSVLESEPYVSERESHSPTLFQQLRALPRAPIRTLKTLLGGDDPETRLNRQIASIANRLSATPVISSNMIQVSLQHPNPHWAARFVNDLLNHHIERIAELNEQANARSFFQKQKNLLAQELEQARSALTAYRERHGPALLSGDQQQLRLVLARIEGERVSTETQLLEQQAAIEYLTRALAEYPETIDSESRISESEEVTLLNQRILELELERSELLSRFTPTSTRVREIDRRIEEAKALLATKERDTLTEVMKSVNPAYQSLQIELVQAEARMVSYAARLGALEEQIVQYRERMSEIERSAAQLQRLEDEVETKNEAYISYLRKEEEARLSSALDASRIVNLTVVENASVPPRPEPSTAPTRISIGGALGLIFGLALAFLRDWIDPAVKSSVQARRLSDLPVIAEIPHA